jgi:hypothetical protein
MHVTSGAGRYPRVAHAAVVGALLWTGVATADPPRICIARPSGDAAGADGGAALGGSLAATLGGARVDTVQLETTDPAGADADARARGCTHVLLTRVTQSHGSGLGSMLKRIAPMAASALPVLGGRGGGAAASSAVAQGVAQSQAAAAAASAQQQGQAAMPAAGPSTLKSGDALTLEYRLLAVGQPAPLKSEKLEGKAHADGEDVLTPLVARVGLAVASTAAPIGGAAPAPEPAAASHGLLGGLFGRKDPAPPVKTASATATHPPVDCDHLPPQYGMTPETCRMMNSAQASYDRAKADPSASRPGDEQMSCDQIMAELRTQHYTAPDRAQAAKDAAAADSLHRTVTGQAAEVQAIGARESATVAAAAAADRATSAATMGIARGHATDAAVAAANAENRATGERMAAERAPLERDVTGSAGRTAADAAQQLDSNPRIARLMQLASDRHCRN